MRSSVQGRDDDGLHQGSGDEDEVKCIYLKNAMDVNLLMGV